MNFNLQKAMANLGIRTIPFDARKVKIARGYSHLHSVAINPEERWPELVALHEIAHIVMGHTTLGERHGYTVNTLQWKQKNESLFESEAHMTAMTAAVMAGIEFDISAEVEHLGCYTRGRRMPRDSVARVAQTAMKIIEAGS